MKVLNCYIYIYRIGNYDVCGYEKFLLIREFSLHPNMKTVVPVVPVVPVVYLSWRTQDVLQHVIRRWQLNTHPINCNSPPSNGVFHINQTRKHSASSLLNFTKLFICRVLNLYDGLNICGLNIFVLCSLSPSRGS